MRRTARPAISALARSEWSDDAHAVLGGIDEVAVYRLPMNVRFRGVTEREGILLCGSHGWGECAPFWDYGPEESARWLASGIESATAPWLPPVRWLVPVNLTVPALSPDEAVRRVSAQPGCQTAKVKVAETGQLREEDLLRVFAVSEEMALRHGDDARVRVDANAGWSVTQACRMLADLNAAAGPVGGLEYAEQPVADAQQLAELRRRTEVPLAADESLRRATRPLDVKEMRAADIAVLKVAPLGGIRAASDLSARLGLPTVVSSALESSIGIAAGVSLACHLRSLSHACGLNTVTMFAADVVETPLVADDSGALTMERAENTRRSALHPHAERVDRDTVARWAARLNRMAAVLRAQSDHHAWPLEPASALKVSASAPQQGSNQ